MAEYIDKSAVIAMIDEFVEINKAHGFPVDIFDMEMLKKRIEQIPAADVAQVVRCKDCIFKGFPDEYDTYFCERTNEEIQLSDFCSHAVREEQNND